MTPGLIKGYRYQHSIGYFYKEARVERKRRRKHWVKYQAFLLLLTILSSIALLGYSMETLNSQERSLDRVEGGQWVTTSFYWEDKVVSNGKKFNPIGLYVAHKTLPIGTHIRVTNPANKRSINVIVYDRGPYVAGRDLDLTLGAATLLNFKGLGTLYMEVIEFGPRPKMNRPVVENLFNTKIDFAEK